MMIGDEVESGQNCEIRESGKRRRRTLVVKGTKNVLAGEGGHVCSEVFLIIWLQAAWPLVGIHDPGYRLREKKIIGSHNHTS